MNIQKNNAFVTKENNALLSYWMKKIQFTPKIEKFLKDAYSINSKGITFTCEDFGHLSNTNFRQKILKCKPVIERVGKGIPQTYKLKGMHMPLEDRKITLRGMGGGAGFLELLMETKEQPTCIHDIKLNFHSKNLHNTLLNIGKPMNKSNKGIQTIFPNFRPNMTIKAMTYPKTTIIDIGCSYKPLVYDIRTAKDLIFLAGQITSTLNFITLYKADIPNYHEWIFAHYHLNKDSHSMIKNGTSYHTTFENALDGMIRYYSKVMPDGKTKLRVEQIQTPNVSFDAEFDKMIENDNQIREKMMILQAIEYEEGVDVHLATIQNKKRKKNY